MRVLDLGCIGHTWKRSIEDSSWLHGEILKNAQKVIGIDFLESDVKMLNARGWHSILHGDATNLNLNAKFDVIVVGDLIEHVENIPGLFRTFQEHLDSNGTVVITTPNPFFINHLITILLNNQIAVNKEHVYWFDPSVITELSRRFGFSVQELQWLTDSDRVSLKQMKGVKMKEKVFVLMYTLLSPIRMLRLFRPYLSSEFGIILARQ